LNEFNLSLLGKWMWRKERGSGTKCYERDIVRNEED